MSMVEIEWAEDESGRAIKGPVGPFESDDAARAWAEGVIYNGKWNVGQSRVAAHRRGCRD